MVNWAEMKVSLEYPKAEYAAFIEAVDALQIDLDSVDSQAACIAELEQALREIAKLSDAERGGDIYIKMQKVNEHATAALK